ncbi:MAG: SLC13 family permease, partial [Bacteroidota bacterium]|nr:SLC13 family permease [Bacteroidota bacterium]
MDKILADNTIKRVKFLALGISILLFSLLLYFPVFEIPSVDRAFALLIMVAILWMTEAIPLALTGLLIPLMASLLHLVPSGEAFHQFAHPIIFLFMGGFVIAGALTQYGLDRLLAQKLINLAKGNFYKSAILLMLATSLTACWVSNTAATAMMIPLGLGLLGVLSKKGITAESKFLILGIAYSANIGGVITMVASPPNAIGAAILELPFTSWLRYSLPVFLLTFPVMILLLTLYFNPDRKMKIGELMETKEQNPPNKTLVSIFILIVTMWLSDSLLSPLLNLKDSFSSLVAVLGIFLIFITGLLNWKQIIKSIQWDVLLLFGGGLTLGMLVESSGLGIILVAGVAKLITIVPLFIFLWIIVLFSIIMTEFMSNTASAALILPLLFTLATQMHINPMILVFPATVAASFGFMLPAGTPPNAMAYASGLVPRIDMMKI